MKKWFRILSMALCGILLLSCAGALAESEPATLKVVVARHAGDQSKSYSTKPFVKRLEADLNMKIEWVEVVTDLETVAATLMAAGDEMPDVWLGFYNQAVSKNPELFADLSGLLEENCPKLLEFYKENGFDWSLCTESDGSIRALLTGMYYSPNSATDNLPWINQKWLDNLGLAMPTNTDELLNVLRAFKAEDANGNGDPNDEIPLDFSEAGWCDGIGMWGYPWGVAGVDGVNFYLVKDGTVQGIANTDDYRAFLEFMHTCYEEGLINQEGFSQTEDQMKSSVTNWQVGTYFNWSAQNWLGTNKEAEQYVFLGMITVPGAEDKFCFPGNNAVSANLGFSIAENSPHKAEALRMWEYLSSTDELRWLTARGPEGMFWKYGEDGATHMLANNSAEQLAALIEQYGLSEDFDPTWAGASFYMDNWFPIIPVNTSYAPPASEEEPLTQGWCRQLAIQAMSDAGAFSQGMSKTAVPAELQEEFTFTCEGLEDYIKAYRAQAIIDGVTDESWEAYLKELEDYGYGFYLEFYQKKLDGNF